MLKEYDLDLILKAGAAAPDLRTIFNLERLHRLHPHWIIAESTETGDGTRYAIRDHATEERFSHTASLLFEDGSSPAFDLTLDGGPVSGLRLFVKGKRWTVATQAPASEMEESLLLWLRGIREYLRLYLTTSPYTRLFRLLMNKIILPMTPSQRKICLMLWRFTLLEILVIVMIGVGWVLFMR
jgi:hypothetical protein